jgi:hypothetical protein
VSHFTMVSAVFCPSLGVYMLISLYYAYKLSLLLCINR